jgi:phosphocarrier protein HPr
MNNLEEKLSRTVTVINDLGLHARAAAMLAKLAGNARFGVWLIKNWERADASSIIDILSLGCFKGTRLTVRIDHPEDMETLDGITVLFEKGFEEL